jgi:SAM-dependent methyltransferase
VTGPAGYAERARHYAAEIARVPAPRLLPGLLRSGLRVAEVPSGTGHFLDLYAAASAEVTLIDACPRMLEAARRQACSHLHPVRAVCTRVQDLSRQTGLVDLAVLPNAALNQLAADADPGELLTAAARILAPGGSLLAQVLLLDDSGTTTSCGFYDPASVEDTWLTDRHFAIGEGRHLGRRRRHRRDGDRLCIDFEFTEDNQPVYAHHVCLRLLTVSGLTAAADDASLTVLSIMPGDGGFHEILVAAAGRNPL